MMSLFFWMMSVLSLLLNLALVHGRESPSSHFYSRHGAGLQLAGLLLHRKLKIDRTHNVTVNTFRNGHMRHKLPECVKMSYEWCWRPLPADHIKQTSITLARPLFHFSSFFWKLFVQIPRQRRDTSFSCCFLHGIMWHLDYLWRTFVSRESESKVSSEYNALS